jgi:hypothetical protein
VDFYAPVVAYLRHDGRGEEAAREMAHGFFAGLLPGGLALLEKEYYIKPALLQTLKL